MSLYSALKDSIRSSACEFLSDAANWKRTFDKIGPIPTPNSSLPNAPAIAYGLFCNRNPEAPTVPPPFTGGQCVGSRYRVKATINRIIGGFAPDPPVTDSWQTTSGDFGDQIWGPITSITLTGQGQGSRGYTAYSSLTITARPSSSGTAVTRNFVTQAFSLLAIESITTEVISGSNNCGDPPSPPPPAPQPNSNVFSPTVTFVNDNNVTVTINPTFVIGVAYVNATAEINIPVNVDLGGINVQAGINLNTGDITFGGGFDSSDPSYNPFPPKPCECLPPTTTPEPPPAKPPGVPTIPEPNDPNGGVKKIIGAIATISSVPSNFTVIDGSAYSAPDIGAPYFASVFFGYRLDNGVFAWSEDIPVKVRQQFVVCPFPDGAIAVAIRPRNGLVTASVVPVLSRATAPREAVPIA